MALELKISKGRLQQLFLEFQMRNETAGEAGGLLGEPCLFM